ncbi:MAG: AAA family ATPase [Bacteroidia bacterium]|nr:AAA family ATPase [Bacteroidia bacterium]
MMKYDPITKQKLNSDIVSFNVDQGLNSVNIICKPIRNAAQRLFDAKNQPEVKQLFSVIWHSNELHLMFADTGIGKSILAVALADAISKGRGLLCLDNHHEPLTVLYYDFELSDRQFRKRYSDDIGNEYSFSNYFFIDTIDFTELDKQYPGRSFTGKLFNKLQADIEEHQANVLIIDNLTYLNGQSTQDTQVALDVMRNLNDLKNDFDLSILVLAHTPKRSMSYPITINDLAGSKHLSNFADSVSTIGKSVQGTNIRYIKQLKSRSSEVVYDSNNVICCEIAKKDSLLTFTLLTFTTENEHLNFDPASQKEEQKEAARELRREGKSVREISQQLGVPVTTIHRWTKNLNENSFQGETNGTDGTCPF